MHNIQPEMIYTKSCTTNSTCTCNVAYLVSILYDKKPWSANSMVAMTFVVVIQECTLKKSSRGAMSTTSGWITEHPVLRQKRRSTIPLFINPVLLVFHKTVGYGMLPSKCYVIRCQLLCFWKNKHPLYCSDPVAMWSLKMLLRFCKFKNQELFQPFCST
jgi:hypothetical protein